MEQATTDLRSGASGLTSITRRGDVFAFLTALFLFTHFAIWNYKSPDGYLGKTVPPFQMEIVAGTASAPYVYRQGVPQLRRVLMKKLKPGHAAVVVDTLFAAAALVAGALIAAFTFGPRFTSLGTVTTLAALATLYPNDKPESVAMVTATLACVACLLYGWNRTAALIALLATPFRPEFPVLFGAAVCSAAVLIRAPEAVGPTRRMAVLFVPGILVGLAYVALSRLVWWPLAKYPEGTPMFTAVENLRRSALGARPWLTAATMVIGLWWVMKATRLPAGSSLAATRMVVIGAFVALWTLAVLFMGMASEIRLIMPVLPLLVLFGAGNGIPGTFAGARTD